jgi:hypothetical protein
MRFLKIFSNSCKLLAAGAAIYILLGATFPVLAADTTAKPAPTPTTAPSPFDSSKQAACQGLGVTDTGDCKAANTKANTINKTIKNAVNIISLVVGIAAIVMIIVAGLKYITSQGEASNVASAKNTLIYAIVGIVVAALAQVIVRFVLSKV